MEMSKGHHIIDLALLCGQFGGYFRGDLKKLGPLKFRLKEYGIIIFCLKEHGIIISTYESKGKQQEEEEGVSEHIPYSGKFSLVF